MNLNKFTEAEKEKYYQDVCAAIGLDPKLRLLQFIWMDGGDGGSNLVLYALKGATDILRAHRGISVTKLTKDVGDGYIAYQAEGVDKSGRTEIAIGAASTKNLTGERLAYSIMTAQTRALRRMTLQYVGAGLLDESEVHNTTVNVTEAPASLFTPALPAVKANDAPGRDVTPQTGVKAAPEALKQQETPIKNAPGTFIITRGDGVEEIAVYTPFQPQETEVVVDTLTHPKRKYTRKSKGVDLSLPGQVVEPVIAQPPKKVEVINKSPFPPIPTASDDILECMRATTSKETITDVEEAIFQSRPNPTPGRPDTVIKNITGYPLVVGNMPSPGQKLEYTARLSKYRLDILREAGMVSSEPIGGIDKKIRKYAEGFFSGNSDTKNWTVEQWETFLNSMDETVKTEGAQALVQIINKAIGARS